MNMAGEPRSLTVLLRAWQKGDRAALDQLMPLVYDELHQRAGAFMRRERSGHTLSPTALVSEAFLRLAAGEEVAWNDRVHFFAIAARHMRLILVDHARRRSAGKRGEGARPVTLDAELIGGGRPADLVALDDALTALAAFDERKAKAVELSYFGGMEHKEIAAALGVGESTVMRDLRFAIAWLQRHLREGT
jgi:RNA polymerase sigma factor (TIGR02999 family)